MRPIQIIWAYWQEVVNITESDLLLDPIYLGEEAI